MFFCILLKASRHGILSFGARQLHVSRGRVDPWVTSIFRTCQWSLLLVLAEDVGSIDALARDITDRPRLSVVSLGDNAELLQERVSSAEERAVALCINYQVSSIQYLKFCVRYPASHPVSSI